MKAFFTLLFAVLLYFTSLSQIAITAVTTSNTTSSGSYTYTNGANTYNWGLSPNNTTVSVQGFTAGGNNYTYAAFLNGIVKLRRVNNPRTSGNFSLVWAEVVNSGTTFNMLPVYQNDMEAFFDNQIYNKGTDNFFDNTSGNSNNIERLDWILSGGYATSDVSKIGFAVFERGATAAHDPFCIAAITSLDVSGNPASYGNIVRVTTASYGDPGPNVTYRILKAPYPSNLLDAGTGTQNRGGVIISLQNLGITSGQRVYGYSLFSNDLPAGATPANLVDFTNATYFPINTGNPGGIDLVATTGVYIDNSILPVKFINFTATENNGTIDLRWKVENEISVNKYEVERSTDGILFETAGEIKSNNLLSASNYFFKDNVSSLRSNVVYYRIKEHDNDNTYYYSNILAIKRNSNNLSLALFPNPVQDVLNVTIVNMAANSGFISVVNSYGAQVLLQQVNIAPGNHSISLNGINKLPKGNYILSIRFNNGKIFTEQFLKQ